MYHLAVRVPWHDHRWDGTVCQHPDQNPYCGILKNIQRSRDVAAEQQIAGKSWSEGTLPPCHSENGAFMNAHPWKRLFKHPYRKNNPDTHGMLLPTLVEVPPYTTFAVPYFWMLAEEESQQFVQRFAHDPLPDDVAPPFPSEWVFGRARQKAISHLFFDSYLEANVSLALFYCKQDQPVCDGIARLLVGLGEITKVWPLQEYLSSDPQRTYPFWERRISHSIRPEGQRGFLLPYHDYLEATGDAAEDQRRRALLPEIALTVASAHVRSFSYAGELVTPDILLCVLQQALGIIDRIIAHGIAAGDWEAHKVWVNAQIAQAWEDRGVFPGTGAVLEAMGMPMGTALVFDLIQSKMMKRDDDPWPVIDSLLRGNTPPPRATYARTLASLRPVWAHMSTQRKALLHLFARFALSHDQARRWYDEEMRASSLDTVASDTDILANPCRITEIDMQSQVRDPIALEIIERGLLPPESRRMLNHPVPAISRLEGPNDPRRVRAAIVSLLSEAAERGDTLLAYQDIQESLAQSTTTLAYTITSDWLTAYDDLLSAEITIKRYMTDDGAVLTMQMCALAQQEQFLRDILHEYASQVLPSLDCDWESILRQEMGDFKEHNPRHRTALAGQVQALEQLTTRRLSVLIGRAGTGKTSVIRALIKSDEISRHGILLLAPTGKARANLTARSGLVASTVDAFLVRYDRYDRIRQRLRLHRKKGKRYQGARTVVIDECSMLTLTHFITLFETFDLRAIDRIILVGDPNQLPPIGAGRPFADLVSHLEECGAAGEPLGGALARLSEVVRTVQGQESTVLQLASCFTREDPAVASIPTILGAQNWTDLTICSWQNREDLEQHLIEQLQVRNIAEPPPFNQSLGFDEQGERFQADHIEAFQVLSPLRGQFFGVRELNQWFQRRFRHNEMQAAIKYNGPRLGSDQIVYRDKVIQLHNTARHGYSREQQTYSKYELANGDIGVATAYKASDQANMRILDITFARYPLVTFGYTESEFSEEVTPLEMAYALTIHKAQGSEFGHVFLIVPKSSQLLSRELLYTALTRARVHLVLFIEGTVFQYDLLDMIRSTSETVRRNTNLFTPLLRSRD